MKELSEVTPGVTGATGGMCGVLGERVSVSSGQRKARPLARGSTICRDERFKQLKLFLEILAHTCSAWTGSHAAFDLM